MDTNLKLVVALDVLLEDYKDGFRSGDWGNYDYTKDPKFKIADHAVKEGYEQLGIKEKFTDWQTRIKTDTARLKLSALGLSDSEADMAIFGMLLDEYEDHITEEPLTSTYK